MKRSFVMAALLGTLAFPTVVSAQALDVDAGTQAVFDLAAEVRASSALKIADSQDGTVWGRMCPGPIDPFVRARAEADLNAFDQRAVALANRTSYSAHARAMLLVRDIEHAYNALQYPVVPDACYVAPGS